MQNHTLTELYCKTTVLIKYFTSVYFKPHFELISIDTSPNIENCLVHFIDNYTGTDLYKNIQDIISNKTLLKYFSCDDASRIGYFYGKLISRNEIKEIL